LRKMSYHLDFLELELNRRKNNNSRYSLRAFAKFLDIGPATLSRILNGQQDLSIAITKKILNKLKVSSEERVLFISSVLKEKKEMVGDLVLNSLTNENLDNLEVDLHSTPFRFLYNSSSYIVAALDPNLKIIFANNACSELYGLEPKEMIGRNATTFDLPKIVTEVIREVVQLKEEKKVEYFFQKDEKSYWFESVYTPLLNTSNKVICIISFSHNISEAKKKLFRLEYCEGLGQIVMDSTCSIDFMQAFGNYTLEKLYNTSGVVIFISCDCGKEMICFHRNSETQSELEKNFKLIISQKGIDTFIREEDVWLSSEAAIKSFLHINTKNELINLRSVISVPLKTSEFGVFGMVTFIHSHNGESYKEDDLNFFSGIGSRLSHMLAYKKLSKALEA
jgi:PAS domain S-box-containing protein